MQGQVKTRARRASGTRVRMAGRARLAAVQWGQKKGAFCCAGGHRSARAGHTGAVCDPVGYNIASAPSRPTEHARHEPHGV